MLLPDDKNLFHFPFEFAGICFFCFLEGGPILSRHKKRKSDEDEINAGYPGSVAQLPLFFWPQDATATAVLMGGGKFVKQTPPKSSRS